MAVVTFRQGERVITAPGTAVEVKERNGYMVQFDWMDEPKFLGRSNVIKIKRVNTMRVHCFYCWNDATRHWQVEVCDEHAPTDAPILLARYKPGPNDDR